MIRQVFETLEALAEEQGFSLGDVLQEDTADHLRINFRLADPGKFFDSVQALGNTLEVELKFSLDSEGATFIRTPQGEWSLEAAPKVFGELVGEGEDRHAWRADEVLEAFRQRQIAVEAVLRLDKTAWRTEIEESTGRSCWIGYSEDSFGAWLQSRSWRRIAKELFARPAGVVIIHRWPGAAVELGSRLVIQGPDLQDRGSPPDDVPWPQVVDGAFARAAHLRVSDVSDEWMLLLLRTAALCAAELFVLANQASATRQSGGMPVLWDINDEQPVTRDGVEGILSLVRWTSEEPTNIRLAIAWRIAGNRITNPLNGPSAPGLVTVADIAYGSAIDTGVREALARQAELERSFREIDSTVASARESMTQVIDATVIRALAAVIATGIAAATADDFRGWLIAATTTLIALYVLAQATVGLATHKRDIEARLDGFDVLVRERGPRLAESLTDQIRDWRKGTQSRVRRARFFLVSCGVVLFVGGMIATSGSLPSEHEERSTTQEDHSTPTPSSSEVRIRQGNPRRTN